MMTGRPCVCGSGEDSSKPARSHIAAQTASVGLRANNAPAATVHAAALRALRSCLRQLDVREAALPVTNGRPLADKRIQQEEHGQENAAERDAMYLG